MFMRIRCNSATAQMPTPGEEPHWDEGKRGFMVEGHVTEIDVSLFLTEQNGVPM